LRLVATGDVTIRKGEVVLSMFASTAFRGPNNLIFLYETLKVRFAIERKGFPYSIFGPKNEEASRTSSPILTGGGGLCDVVKMASTPRADQCHTPDRFLKHTGGDCGLANSRTHDGVLSKDSNM
jgi:hypothetical protein